MTGPIHHTFGPHVTISTMLRSLALLCMPWRWQQGHSSPVLQQALAHAFDGDVYLFSTGREALLTLLKALDLQPGEEVILQGFTCAVLPNAIQAAGGVPIYVDIDLATLNIDPAQIENRLTDKTRAIICQHTFGIPSDTAALRKICDAHSLALIEDMAHILPDSKGPNIGKDGDFMLLSFGRDKAISGITGGALISKHDFVSKRIEDFILKAKHVPKMTIARLLLYPILYFAAKPLFGIGIGKAILALAKRLGLLLPILTAREKNGYMSPIVYHMPNACADIALSQLQQLEAINTHRRTLTMFYYDALSAQGRKIPGELKRDMALQKFPIVVSDADVIRRELKKRNIHLEDGWTGAAVCPRSTNQEAAQYTNPCTNVDTVKNEILSLPTHPTMSIGQAVKLLDALPKPHDTRL